MIDLTALSTIEDFQNSDLPYLRHMNDVFSSSKNVYDSYLISGADSHMELSEYIADLIDILPEKAEKALQYIDDEYEETLAFLERYGTDIIGLIALENKKSRHMLTVARLFILLSENYENKARIALEDEEQYYEQISD